jgi:hypothetical protein
VSSLEQLAAAARRHRERVAGRYGEASVQTRQAERAVAAIEAALARG